MLRFLLPLALVGLTFLPGCMGVVRIAGQSDALREGGAVVVCYPNTAILNVSDLSIESWQYPLLGQRVEPDSAGRFSVNIRIRRASEIVILSGLHREHLTVDKGDSLHFAWRPGDSAMRITGRQRALTDVAGYYDDREAPELRAGIQRAFYEVRPLHCGTYSQARGTFRDTVPIDSLLLLRDRYISLKRELLVRFGAQPFALERMVRKCRRKVTASMENNYRCVCVGGTLDQLYSRSDFPKKDQALSWYYQGLENWENTKRARRYDAEGTPDAERQWYSAPAIKKTVDGVLAASSLVLNGDGDLLYDSLRYAQKLSDHIASAGESHPGAQLHRQTYEARMAWIREPYSRYTFLETPQPLDSLFARYASAAPRGFVVWLWLEEDDEFIRGAHSLAQAERALARQGVQSLYVPFYDGESLVSFALYRFGLKAPFAAITSDSRAQLLHLLGGAPLRRARCLLFDGEGRFVAAELPGSQEADKLADAVEAALMER